MAETSSNMLPLGTIAPDFALNDACTNQKVSLNMAKSDTATVIMFICNHCPYVQYIQTKIAEVAKIYQDKGVSFIAINANDVKNYPSDSPEQMRQQAQEYHFNFPYLVDETQEVAKAYKAACTPDFYIFDKNLACVYRGRFDNATPGNRHPVTGKDLTNAFDSYLQVY